MRLDELIATEKQPSVTLKNVKEWIDEVRGILGTTKYPMPKISYEHNHWKNALGTCLWRPGLESDIKINTKVQKDMATFKRVIAHELCHDAVNMTILNVAYKQKIRDGAIASIALREILISHHEDDEQGHGPNWLKFADMMNAKFGKDYTTRYSDDKDIYKGKPEEPKYNSRSYYAHTLGKW